MSNEYCVIKKEDAEKLECPKPQLPEGFSQEEENCFQHGFRAGKQAILSKAKLVDLDEAIDSWLSMREGCEKPSYKVYSYSNMKFSQFIEGGK